MLSKPKPAPKQSQLPLLSEELQLKLVLRGITYPQLQQMLYGLKLQAEQIKQVIQQQDLRNILKE